MLVLDTFNVLHTVGVLPPDLAGLDVPGLADLILRSRYAGEKVVFACDGLPADDLPGPGALALADHPQASIEVRYSGRGVTADDLIRRMVDASTAPRRMIVVSSDHAIARDARKRRCVTLSSEEFLQHLADDAGLPRGPASPPRTPPPMMSEAQVNKWIKTFGVDENELQASMKAEEARPSPPKNSPATSHPIIGANLEMPKPVLPEDLISEAEALWQREGRSAAPRPQQAPPTSRPPSPPAPAPSPVEPEANPQEEIDLDAIDMDSILPADGQTRRLTRKDDRDRRA